MPLYEYECSACHKRTEKIQKFSDPEITACPKCGGALERVLSAPAISFKGGGWFADGYGNAKPKNEGKSESSKTDKSTPASVSPESKSSSDSATSTPPAAPAAVPPATSSPSPSPSKS